jgi:hypothetical protein
LRSSTIVVLGVILSSCVFFTGGLQAGTIYKYVDKDGNVVFTDTPPPEIKAKPIQTFPDLTESEKQELDKEKSSQMQNFREADGKRKEKEGKIRAAREEYERALKDGDRYRANKNQASGFAQQKRWRDMIEEQNKEIEEQKKKLQELESTP